MFSSTMQMHKAVSGRSLTRRNPVRTYHYDPYGNVTGSTGTTYNRFGYAGEYTDGKSGLVYLRARYYDPSTEEFLSRDPLVETTGSLMPTQAITRPTLPTQAAFSQTASARVA